MLAKIRTTLSLLILTVLVGCAAPHRVVGNGSAPIANNGYVLIRVRSDMQGILPLKPASFWGTPFLLGVGGDKHYLLSMKPGTYSLGALMVDMKFGWDTFDTTPFKVEPGKVAYLGQHHFYRKPRSMYSWNVRDTLEESLAGLSSTSLAEIRNLPIERHIPINK